MLVWARHYSRPIILVVIVLLFMAVFGFPRYRDSDDGPPADAIVQRYFKTRRYAGSKDRRAVRELVYRAIRRAGERPDSGRAAMLGLAEEGGPSGPWRAAGRAFDEAVGRLESPAGS